MTPQEAVQQSIMLLRALEETAELRYTMFSARSVLVHLNLDKHEQDEVLDYMHKNGFAHCLDPRYPSNNERTPEHACWWGVDQLRSRLQCVR